ncbi:MAG TPA: hypothetical protein VL175_08745 [Pirellulales bacterium]|jgi:hypothetical protein|nr:hypothetical protein [Pirellulales bacterium]
MKAFALFSCALVCWSLVLGSSAVAADEKVDVTGVWNVEIEIGGQTGMPVFTLKQDGEKITGKYKGQFGEADVTGKLKGNEIEFSFEAQGAKITYTGTVDKDTMKGKANYADQASGEWKAKKKSS